MIDGKPRVSERDGLRIVVDANGDVVVCRGTSQHVGGTSRYYHRIDADHFETTGEIQAACGEVAHHHDADWTPRRKADLDGIWTGCSYHACFGDYDPGDTTPKASGHDGLAATLTDMSVEEFDAAVAAHNGGEY
jgi:hypothetical protein